MNCNIKKLAFLFSFVVCLNTNLHSQDRYNAWVVGLGVNVVDISLKKDVVGFVQDYLNGKVTDLNMSGGFVRVYGAKYLNGGFAIQFSASTNKILTGYGWGELDNVNYSFLAIDSKIRFDLNYMIGDTDWFDPYTVVGGGYSKIENISNLNIAAGWGFNAWISDTVGINFQSDYNHNLSQEGVNGYFQHSLSLVFKLNIRQKLRWRGGGGRNFLSDAN